MVHVPSAQATAVLGIVTALQKESKPLTHSVPALRTPQKLAQQVNLIVSGMGPKNARIAAQILLQQGATALLSWGTAAALDPGIKSGTLVIPNSVVDEDGVVYPTDKLWQERICKQLTDRVVLAHGDIVTSKRVIASPQEKQEIFKHRNAQALDMESADIAGLAQANAKPFMAIRAIVDTADLALPYSVLTAIDSEGQANIVKLISSLVLRPQDWRSIIRLSKNFGYAQKALSAAVSCLGEKLAMPE